MSDAQKAGKAGILLLFRKGWGAVVSFGVMAYLARTLSQSDFGIVAISGTLINIIQAFAISGISEYVIYYNGKDEKEVTNSAFWLNLFLTVAVCVAVLVASPFWARFYNDERISKIIYLLLVGFFFNMLSSIAVAQFRKTLNYKPMVMIQTIFGTISQLSQVLFALLGFGVYSLALPNAIVVPLMAMVLIYKSGFRPKLYFNREYWGRIFNYTKHVIGSSVLSKVVHEGDSFVIGKFLGMDLLGVYNLAFRFARLFADYFLPIFSNITMPVYSRIHMNKERLRNTFLRSLKLIAFVTIPVLSFQILFAEPLINLFYGPKWTEAVIPFQILSFMVLVRCISSPTSGLYNATGNPQIGFYYSLVFTPFFIGSVLLASLFKSIIIVTGIIALTKILGSIINFYLARKLINEKAFKIMKEGFQPVLPVVIIAIPIMLLRLLNIQVTIIEIIVFLSGYILLFRILLLDNWKSLIVDLNKMIPSRLQKMIPSRLRLLIADDTFDGESSISSH